MHDFPVATLVLSWRLPSEEDFSFPIFIWCLVGEITGRCMVIQFSHLSCRAGVLSAQCSAWQSSGRVRADLSPLRASSTVCTRSRLGVGLSAGTASLALSAIVQEAESVQAPHMRVWEVSFATLLRRVRIWANLKLEWACLLWASL